MKPTLDNILKEYGANLDDETKKKIFERQKRKLRAELKRAGKLKSNFKSKKQFRELKKLSEHQGKH